MDAQEAIAEADKYPEIRLFTAAKVSSTTPLYELKEVEQSWTIASSSNCLPSDIIFYWVFSCCCAVLVLNSCSCPLVCNFSSKVIMNLNLEIVLYLHLLFCTGSKSQNPWWIQQVHNWKLCLNCWIQERADFVHDFKCFPYNFFNWSKSMISSKCHDLVRWETGDSCGKKFVATISHRPSFCL